MSRTEIDPYVFAAVVGAIYSTQSVLDKSYMSRENTLSQLRAILEVPVPQDSLERVLDQLVSRDVVSIISDEAAGQFFQIRPDSTVRILQEGNTDHSSLTYKYQAIGTPFLLAALNNLVPTEEGDSERMPLSQPEIPASDRIVTLTHNQSSEVEERTSEIIASVEHLNTVDKTPGLREIILGQLRAGRELIRTGSFKLYVLQVTLIDSLRFLAQRYEKEAVGALAAALLTALSEHLGLVA